MARYVFELWANKDRTEHTFCTRDSIDRNHPSFVDMVHRVFSIEADTYEEAMAACYLRRGFDPYKPVGNAVECPNNCGAHYYPEGSGECPICGQI
jgi:hypothetical protein